MTSHSETLTALMVCRYCGQPIGANEREHIHRVENERSRELRESLEREFQARVAEEMKKAEEEAQTQVKEADEARRQAEEQLRKATERAAKVEEEAEMRVQARVAEEVKKAEEEAQTQVKEAEEARRQAEERLQKATERAAKVEEEAEMRVQARVAEEVKKADEEAQAQVKEAEEARKQIEEELRKANERAAKAQEEAEVRVQARLAEERQKAEEQAEKQYAQKITDMSLDLQQRENQIAQWKKQVDELRAKVESKEAIGRGIMQEEQLVQLLRNEFPTDRIELVAGRGGPDITHDIIDQGQSCGLIIYESKRVRSWQSSFIEKLAREKVSADADYAVLVSTAFPANEQNFCMKDGIPVVHPNHLVPFVNILRSALVAIKLQSESMEEAEYKYQQLVNFLSGPEFRNRIQAVLKNIDRLESLQQKEKRAHDRVWSEQTQVHRRTTQMAIEVQTEIAAILAGAVQAQLRESA